MIKMEIYVYQVTVCEKVSTLLKDFSNRDLKKILNTVIYRVVWIFYKVRYLMQRNDFKKRKKREWKYNSKNAFHKKKRCSYKKKHLKVNNHKYQIHNRQIPLK